MANWVQFKTTENGEHKAWFNLDAAEVIKVAPKPYQYATLIIMPGDPKGHLVFEKIDAVIASARSKV